MVKALVLLFLSICITVSADEVKVFAEIQQEGAYEGQPLKGLVTITHNKSDPIDINSFRIEKKALTVDFVKDVRISPTDPTVLSIYSFQMPGESSGLYALPEIAVQVGSKEYHSVMTSYSVLPRSSGLPPSPPISRTASVASGEGKVALRLEAGVNGKTTLYPGQRTVFQYHYYFEGNIALTVEKVPLLDAEGFVKIGEKEIKDSSQGNISIREISQEVEAVKPGTYTFGPSVIEGYSYQNDARGNPVYTSQKLVSEAPVVTITVLPFQLNDKPISFNGAVGNYTLKTQLLSSPNVEVGDELSLALLISGTGNLKSVPIPDLCCQPGFSGFFKLSDLPPVEEVTEGMKKTVVRLRVLTDQIKEIPSVEFSFFDPNTSSYSVLHSQPIPISVVASTRIPVPSSDMQIPPQKNDGNAQEKIHLVPTPIEIESILPLSTVDLYNKPFGTWWDLAVIPLGIALLIYQVQLRNFIIWSRGQAKQMSSSLLFQQAFAIPKTCQFGLLRRALLLALFEAGEIPSDSIEAHALSSDGLSGEVKTLLSEIEEKRFAGKGEMNVDALRSQSEALLKKIKKN